MSLSTIKVVAIAVAAFASGLVAASLPSAIAATEFTSDLSERQFTVSIDEVKQNLAFGDEFAGSYSKSVTLSDGSTRKIKLTPMAHNGKQVVELKDTGGLTYMSLSDTTTNGNLMIQVKDNATSAAALKAEGWK